MAKGRCAINKRRRAPGNPTKFLEDPSGRRTRCMKRILGVVRKCMQLTHMIGPDLNLLLFMSTVDPLEALGVSIERVEEHGMEQHGRNGSR